MENIIKIQGNILHYGNDFVQLSNISDVRMRERKKHGLLWLVLIFSLPFIFVPSLFMSIQLLQSIWYIISVSLVILGIIFTSKRCIYLLFVLSNSGSELCFACKSKDFLIKVKDLISESINNTSPKNLSINLDKCQIGNSNEMNNSEAK